MVGPLFCPVLPYFFFSTVATALQTIKFNAAYVSSLRFAFVSRLIYIC